MAKPKNDPKIEHKSEHVQQEAATIDGGNLAASAATPNAPPTAGVAATAANSLAAGNDAASIKREPTLGKKELGGKGKKAAGSVKPAPFHPSEAKLESLKTAVELAGGADQLLDIMHHVDLAGGRADVVASIEAYRALKQALGD